MEVRMIKRLKAGWRRALGYFRRNGISAAAWAVAERLWQEMQQKGYRYEPPGQDVLSFTEKAEDAARYLRMSGPVSG